MQTGENKHGYQTYENPYTENPREPPVDELEGIGKTDSHESKGLTLNFQGPQAWSRVGADKTTP